MFGRCECEHEGVVGLTCGIEIDYLRDRQTQKHIVAFPWKKTEETEREEEEEEEEKEEDVDDDEEERVYYSILHKRSGAVISTNMATRWLHSHVLSIA